MDRATVSRIEGWDARPVPGGYAGLADLAEAEFTGAVAAGGTHLFMLNGRVVGVFDGTLSAFEGAESTAYEAPDPSLPLLFAMKERGGDVRAKYYTDDTPLHEVDGTLTEGGFTGYLELSENVLSGDYYVVYYGGRSLSAAFVGNEERVVTGEEAFELAADEVGIYEVRTVDLEVVDVPEPPEDAAPTVVGATGPDDEAANDADQGADSGPEPAGAAVDESETGPETEARTGADAGEADEQPAGEAETDATGAAADQAADAGADGEADADVDIDAEDGGDATEATGADPDAVETPPIEDAEPDATAEEPTDRTGNVPSEAAESGTTDDSRPEESVDRTPPAGDGPSARTDPPREGGEPDERFREEERWREARTVPALDPEETELPPANGAREQAERPPSEAADRDGTAGHAEAGDPELDAMRERARELESELHSTERERRQQADRVEALTEERDELLEDRAALQARIEELEARIETQQDRLKEQQSEPAAGATASPASDRREAGGADAIDPGTALDQTDLFVRYSSKGKATLQTAHDGRAGKEEVAGNLRLETHSRFAPAGVTVDGRPFEEYLAGTIEYRFVAWLIEEFLYELQETGTERGLRAAYDALPAIDRAEFAGTVTSVDEAGNDQQETFDVVCRDRMGKPLVVANINDSLDPATGEMMGGLVEDATAAAEAHESVGAAFLVTASFFEPDALETAAEATGGGFLSRDSKKSFVKLSRKGGYHLCLVEARGDDFHVAVPEL